jgi:hypothetical protein
LEWLIARFVPRDHGGLESMLIWKVKAIWLEDEAEASEQWEVHAETAHEAVREATAHIRFQPHHVEVLLCPRQKVSDLQPGEVRRIAPS